MSDDVTKINANQQSKNPVESSANKLREALQKEFQKKFDEQLTKTLNAAKIFKNEKAELQRMSEDFENEKVNMKDLLGDII